MNENDITKLLKTELKVPSGANNIRTKLYREWNSSAGIRGRFSYSIKQPENKYRGELSRITSYFIRVQKNSIEVFYPDNSGNECDKVINIKS